MDHNQTIGAKIKTLRTDKHYTLKTLSDKTGLSVGFLSQAERGLSSIAVDSLAKVAACLDVPLATFFSDQAEDLSDPVVHGFSAHRTVVGPQIIESVLSSQIGAFNFLPKHVLLLPCTDLQRPEMCVHSGEEFVYVLTGVVTLWLEDRQYALYPGDSIQIHSNQPHNWANHTNKTAELLSINYPNPLLEDGEAPLGLSVSAPADFVAAEIWCEIP